MDNNYDVIISGTGAAGLYSALMLPRSMKILIITKRELMLCNSSLAQGGIAAVYKPDDDTIQLHSHDTLVAGGFRNNPDSVKLLVSEAAGNIQTILDLGVDFDKNADGTLNRTLEGGHSRRRIFHHKDTTGYEIVLKLSAAVRQLPNVTIMENTMLCSAKKTSTGFSALLLSAQETSYMTANCHYLILATGGIGRVYDYTTNTAIATGDGISLAYEMGAQIKNLSLIQFHPTAFNDRVDRECFLISEAVRGEGAYLLNCHGERFMQDYDPRLELAPRDVVSHAIMQEAIKTGSDEFYLDITRLNADFIRTRFPNICYNLEKHGYDLTKDRIPIFPCQHYLMGGINVNTNAESTIRNLFAVGECSHTGVHGNNRLASNSLLEALVFSHRAANEIVSRAGEIPEGYDEYTFTMPDGDAKPIPHGIRTEIRHIMQKSYFVVPNIPEAVKGFERVSQIKRDLENGNYIINTDYVEAHSLATVAYLVLKEVI